MTDNPTRRGTHSPSSAQSKPVGHTRPAGNAAHGKSGAKSGASGRSRRRGGSGRRGGHGPGRASQETSLPTTRAAYLETRRWLLAQHGSVCAYCERRMDPDLITLDHATPRRGKTAYDRRDNLLLSCQECNAKKKDQSFLAFLLGRRGRAASVVRYGQHLSPMLLHMAREVAGPEATARAERLADPDYPYSD